MIGHQAAGTGGLLQFAGSDNPVECVGMTSVPVGPTASQSAMATVAAPPTTQPIVLSEVCASRQIPGSTPSCRRSLVSDSMVTGHWPVLAMISSKVTMENYPRPARLATQFFWGWMGWWEEPGSSLPK